MAPINRSYTHMSAHSKEIKDGQLLYKTERERGGEGDGGRTDTLIGSETERDGIDGSDVREAGV